MMRTRLGLLSGVVLFASLGLHLGGAWADEAPAPEERPAETQGGTDHPRFKRFPGSVLTDHEHKAFEEYALPVAPDGEGGCVVEMVTYYDLRAAWLRPIRRAIDYVVGAMHRIVLADMRARLEARPAGQREFVSISRDVQAPSAR